jgi:hypothetical protein
MASPADADRFDRVGLVVQRQKVKKDICRIAEQFDLANGRLSRRGLCRV